MKDRENSLSTREKLIRAALLALPFLALAISSMVCDGIKGEVNSLEQTQGARAEETSGAELLATQLYEATANHGKQLFEEQRTAAAATQATATQAPATKQP